ncbi:hypothetical protein D9619_004297 [Psilocybe cf. subviscida]|uniref:DUF7330 domain-containing protein n=1 Tax=Psilocybe cf. subviscida TaxID=2480587 RepID=A0A8H5BQX3_9AGAR|nr:hypothetical protein D9619_004297 [Psilocybe cf. subviscida]
MVDRHKSTFISPSQNPSTQDGASSPSPKHRYPIPAGVQPTNCIQISTVDSIRGVYTIDPGLTPPAFLFTQPPHGYQDRQNVLIESQGGNVYVDLFFLPSSDKHKMISMTLKSHQGSASVRVHDADPQDASWIRGPISIMVTASKKADIYIPRSFRGPLQLVTGNTGEVCYSNALKAEVAPVFSRNGVHNCFIGGLPDGEDVIQTWTGDQLTAAANGAINLYFDDEGDIPTKDTSTGHWAQLQRRLTRRVTSPVAPRPLRVFSIRVARILRDIPRPLAFLYLSIVLVLLYDCIFLLITYFMK